MFADFDRIEVGETRSLTRTINEADVRRFVEMTGDDNPLHIDRAFAEETSFKDIVVHGMLGASFISTVIGTQLPGHGALWVSQSLDFLLPVRLGDVLTVSCTVTAKHERERLLDLDTRIMNQHGQAVLTGRGKVKVLAGKVRTEEPASADRVHVAIVTGATGGIGSAICRRLAEAGNRVVINYRRDRGKAEALAASLNADAHRAIAVEADIATAEGAAQLYEAAVRAFGGVDILVNNASPRINPKPFAKLDWSDFQTHLDVQLKGAFFMIQQCVPDMAARRWGRIVNISSQVIDGPPSSGWTSYAVGKSAVAMLSRYLAAELGPQGVTVNNVSPGMTETSLIGDVPEKVQLMVARQTPLRRLATPSDVAAAVAHLVSDDAGFVTGHTLRVNGGLAMQ
ncbi:SDR family oxidoreductase [Sphingomonas sp. JC676]|uniref:SDR family oxidoreductase n=1 Tax=Sphingomonas sp. JC676 TaxID=2768065 RepID=UPI0016582498|nr:SDR family oxidoreductase [Sphingomonas sp. JC676]MBC9030948.1 SDR family oxidoreductase [Sphingomonas sp. JC676]